MNTPTTLRLAILTLLSLLLAGCVSTRTLQVNYQPGPSSPLTALKPMKIGLEIQNSCPGEEKDRLTQINKAIFVVDGGSVPAVETAFKSELQAAGHQVLTVVTQGEDAHVKVDLKRMTLGMREKGGTRLIKTVLIQADVSVFRAGQQERASQFTVTEAKEKEYTLIASGAMEGMFNDTFRDFVRNTILDPRFAQALD